MIVTIIISEEFTSDYYIILNKLIISNLYSNNNNNNNKKKKKIKIKNKLILIIWNKFEITFKINLKQTNLRKKKEK